MSYTTYTTDAIVCGTYDRNTADRSYRLFTRELGMLWADARSVRLEKSKQRFGLCDFSHIRVSLVRGKSGWKVGSVVALGNYYHDATDQSARGSVVQVVRHLRRYLSGEEANVPLFDYIQLALQVLSGAIQERVFVQEAILVRILADLGYVARPHIPTGLQTQSPMMIESLYSQSTAATVSQLLQQAESVSQL